MVKLKEDKLPQQKAPNATQKAPWHNPLKQWSNQPPFELEQIEAKIYMTVPPKTDCWRKTRHNFIMDNAPFRWHKLTGNFEVMVKVSANFTTMYDKAGLMLRLDSENWILSGMEFFNGRVHHSSSITRDYTEWSLSILPEHSEEQGVWFCVKRLGNTYETFHSFDCVTWIQTRQGIFTSQPSLQVGICAACPLGTEGFKVCFEGYRVDQL